MGVKEGWSGRAFEAFAAGDADDRVAVRRLRRTATTDRRGSAPASRRLWVAA